VAKYEKLLAENPGFEDAKKNFPVILREAGKHYGEKKNDLKKSIDYLSRSYVLDSTDYETVRLFGIANAFSGNLTKALLLFKRGIELEPKNAGAYQNLGNAYYNMGDRINGKKYHDIALGLDPSIYNKK
jgi:superkiller protein 3